MSAERPAAWGDESVSQDGTKLSPSHDAATERELRLRTIEAVSDLLSSAGSMSPERDAISVHSNGYGMWFVPYDPQPMGTAPIKKEEILRRIEAREALNGGKRVTDDRFSGWADGLEYAISQLRAFEKDGRTQRIGIALAGLERVLDEVSRDA